MPKYPPQKRQEFKPEKGGYSRPKSETASKVYECLDRGLNAAETAKVLNMPIRTVRYHKAKNPKYSHKDCCRDKLPLSVSLLKNGNIPGKLGTRDYPHVYARVHRWIFSMPIHYVSEAYKRRIAKRNVGTIENHTVRLYPKRIVITAAAGFETTGKNHAEAEEKGMLYFERIVRRLEDRWKISVWKRDCEFKVYYHTAQVNNETAVSVVAEKKKLRIVDKETGRAWLVVDASTGVPELECVDRERAGDDMARIIEPFYEDLRRGDYLLPSEVKSSIAELVVAVRRSVEFQHEQAENLTSTIKALNAVLELLRPPRPPEFGGGDDGGAAELRRYTG